MEYNWNYKLDLSASAVGNLRNFYIKFNGDL